MTKTSMHKPKLASHPTTLLTITLDLFLWLIITALILLFPPTNLYAVLAFFTLLTPAIFLPLKLLINPLRRPLLLTILTVTLLALRFYHLDQWINITLLIGLIIAIELFFVVK